MRLSLVLFLTTLLNVSANVYSQNPKLTLNLQNVTIKDVLNEIEKTSSYKFIYRNEFVDVQQVVDINSTDESLETVMSELFNTDSIAYRVFEGNIVVITDKSLLQQSKITGKVTDAITGEPIPGVNIVVQGTITGIMTDLSGAFSIEVPNNNAVLVFSFVGYVTESITVNGQSTINVKLTPETKNLEEVVVVGYGTKKKSDVTGSVASVSKERLSQVPVTNLMYAIEGSVAGVSITQTSSVPGSSATASIRGLNSISANTSPFIVTDGIPFYGSLNDINPNDIASIDILKDASAVAIYGTRGANGVILITTKRGNTGKPQIQYSAYGGFEGMQHVLTPKSGVDYVTKYAEYMRQTNQAQTNPVPNAYELPYYNAGTTTDWIKEATQQGIIQDHNISISGGAKDIKYYVSGEYMNQKGVVKGYQYHRASLRSNIDANITNFLSAGTSLFISSNNYDGGRVNLLNASAMSPYSNPFNAVGKYQIYPMYPELLYSNPLIGLYNDRIDRNNNLNINIYAELKPDLIKGLKYRFNGAYIYIPSRYANYSGRDANNLLGTADSRSAEEKTWIIENILTYTKDWNKHHIDFTGLYSAQQTDYFISSISSTSFINDQLSYYNIGAGATVSAGSIPNQSATGSYAYRSDLLSQMGRINYTYDGRYLLTLTARRDGYSAFGANTSKYGLFPSLALGWNISKESFMQNIKVINNLKLRFSYGKAGNQAVGVNQTSTTSGSVRFPFNGVSTIGVLASGLGNANLNWETTKGTNIGLDFAVLNQRINGTIDLYKTNTTDILLRRNLPQITGYSNVWDNLGKMENKGIELSLNTVNVVISGFKWESNLNVSINRNKIIDLYGDKKDDLGNRWFIGQPLGILYDYQMVGVWQTGEDPTGWDPSAKPGDLKFKDQLTVDTNGDGIKDAGDGVINASDRIILGTTLPKWIGGFTNSFSYKNLRLSIFLQTFQGALKNNPDFSYADEQGRRNTPSEVGYWTPENNNNTRPSLSYNNTKGYGFPMDNSYTRIKDVTLSYTLPNSLLNKIGIANLMVYASGRNLYTFTKWIGWDPENNYSTRGSGDWTNNYPFIRSIVFGVNITLL